MNVCQPKQRERVAVLLLSLLLLLLLLLLLPQLALPLFLRPLIVPVGLLGGRQCCFYCCG